MRFSLTKRQLRNRRAFQACIRFVLPDPRLRSRIGLRLRRRLPWLNQACYRWFGWVMFCRLLLPRYNSDQLELRSYSMDIRQVLRDSAMRGDLISQLPPMKETTGD